MRTVIPKLALGSLLATGLSSIGLASPAGAVEPAIVRIPLQIVQEDTTSCDFTILEEFEGTLTIIIFFDQTGTPIDATIHAPFQGTLTNTETGTSVRGIQELLVFEDLQEGTTTFAGLRFLVTFPGAGTVLLDAGRVVFDAAGNVTFEAGPHQVINEDFEEFCGALA